MVRGYITRGRIYHTGKHFMGTGYQSAYQAEGGVSAFKFKADEVGTPYVEIDPTVSEYVANETDECVREMFGRYVKRDGEVAAIFPFQVLGHSFMISGMPGLPPFDGNKEKKSNDNMRQQLKRLKERVLEYVDKENDDAVRKAAHYVAALDSQVVQCAHTDALIDKLMQPLGRRI
jgi:hypothetical protein